MIYLACADKIIEQRQKKVKKLIDELIEANDKMPFWKQFFGEQHIHNEINIHWDKFNKWMAIRMMRQSRCNSCLTPQAGE